MTNKMKIFTGQTYSAVQLEQMFPDALQHAFDTHNKECPPVNECSGLDLVCDTLNDFINYSMDEQWLFSDKGVYIKNS